MTPAQFLARMKRKEIAPAYLFLGAEAYQGRRCREALLDAMLGPDERENGLAQYDLNGSLARAGGGRRALAFAVCRATRHSGLQRRSRAPPARNRKKKTKPTGPAAGGARELAAYMKDPSPGVVLAVRSHAL